MDSGWSLPYFDFMIEKCREQAEQEKDKIKKLMDEEQQEVYENLYLKLLLQRAESVVTPMSVERFLDCYRNVPLSEPLLSSTVKRELSRLAKEFFQLKPLEIEPCIPIVSKEEALTLVGDFIQSTFGISHFKVYEDKFLNQKNYILFDKHCDPSFTISPKEGEFFISVPSSGTCEMISNLAHEAGHVYRMNEKRNIDKDHLLLEYESYSYEVLLLFWMIKNHIYEKEAQKQFLHLMDLLEKVTIVRYFVCNYHLNHVKDEERFCEILEQSNLLERINTSKEELFDLIVLVLEGNIPSYVYSFLLVLNHYALGNYKVKYRNVIKELDDYGISKKILTKKVTDLTNYQKYRNDIFAHLQK